MHIVAGLFDSPAEMGIFFVAWIPGAILGGVVGYLIGRNKGLGTAGIWLGALLGCVGWVIVALLKPASTPPAPGGAPAVTGPASGPAAPGSAAPGWYPDPFRRFHHRYHDGSKWTDQVSTDGRQFTDPPTP